jgi:hypothetical protein
MKIYSLKRISIPKLAVLATGLATALVVGTIAPMSAQARVGYAQNCTGCHGSGASMTATPSTATPAANANYTVALSPAPDGYWVTGNGASVTGSNSSVAMRAPATAGAYTYTVHFRNGNGGTTTFRITVPQVAPPTTIPPTTVPPTTVPPTTVPPTTTPPTTPPTAPSTARITRLSDSSADARDRITISGTGLGRAGVVKFGSVTASVSSWSTTRITVRVPREGDSSQVSVTVTPRNGTASNALTFRYNSDDGDDGDDGDDD